MIQADLNVVLPEVILAVYAMAALMAAVYTTKDKAAPIVLWVTAGVFVLSAFGGAFVDDAFSRFAKVVILLSAAAVLILSQDFMTRHGLFRFALHGAGAAIAVALCGRRFAPR